MDKKYMNDFSLLYPQWLYLIPVFWLISYLFVTKFNIHKITQSKYIFLHPTIRFISNKTEASFKKKNTPVLLNIIALSLLVVALSRPQSFGEWVIPEPEGHEIVLLVDVSQSMSVRDYHYKNKKVARFDVLRGVVSEFVKQRQKDHFSLVAFSGTASTLVPMTFDRSLIVTMLRRLTLGLLGDDTAIGDAISLSAKQFKHATDKKPVIILFSDGDNTAGVISPVESLALAKTLNLRIYTIAITSENNSVDSVVLSNIASKSGGKYYHAKNGNALKKIILDIGSLEKTITPDPVDREIIEWYFVPTLLGLLVLTFSQLIRIRQL